MTILGKLVTTMDDTDDELVTAFAEEFGYDFDERRRRYRRRGRGRRYGRRRRGARRAKTKRIPLTLVVRMREKR